MKNLEACLSSWTVESLMIALKNQGMKNIKSSSSIICDSVTCEMFISTDILEKDGLGLTVAKMLYSGIPVPYLAKDRIETVGKLNYNVFQLVYEFN